VNNKEGIALALYGLGSMVGYRDNDYDKSMEYYERALIIAEEIDLLLLKTSLLNNMSNIYRYRGERDKSLSTINEQAKLAERLGNKKSQIWALMGLAGIYGEDDPDKAYEYNKEALQLSKKIGNKNTEGLLLRSIARYFMDQKKDYIKALEYAKISREIFKKLDDKEYEANSLDFVGEVYIELGDYESALDCANQSLDLNKDIDHERGIFYSTLKIGFLNYKYGKDYNKALEYFSRASKKVEEENTPPIYTLSYIRYISAFYQYIGDYDSAIENQNRAQNISVEINNVNWEISILKKLGFLYTNRGENDKGFEHFRQAKEKSDAMNFSKTKLAQNLMNIGWVYLTKGDYKIAAEQYLDKALELKKETGDDLGLWGSLCLYLSYKHLGRDYDVAHIKKLIAEENDIDFETNYMIYQLLGERSYLKTAYDQVKEREDVLDTNLKEKFYNYPTPKAIIEEWEKVQS
jgi:tetratricopeptide (TPR) repeat protein